MIPLRDDIRARRRPYVTWALIAACGVVYAYQFFTDTTNPEAGRNLVLSFGMIPENVTHGKALWTLLTSMFMHGGIFHFLGNMLYLWIFGDNVEDHFGRPLYVVLYVLSGVFGSVLHILVAPGSHIPTIGASGAISGVLGAYFILFPRARVLTLVPIFFFIRVFYLPAFVLLGFWILMQVLYGCSTVAGGSGVAYFAHIGGFAVGILLALLIRRRRGREAVWYDIS